MAATTLTPLNASQVLILQALAKSANPMTRDKLEKTGAAVSAGNIGPVFKDVLGNYPDSLYGLGLVRPIQMEDEAVTWEITAKGRKVAGSYKTRTRSESAKVPPAALDPVVTAFRRTRTYGMEEWTDADIRELRGLLGAGYGEVGLDDLRRQVVARRKQGAYTDPTEARRKAIERVVREFGPGGTVEPGLLTAAQVKFLVSGKTAVAAE